MRWTCALGLVLSRFHLVDGAGCVLCLSSLFDRSFLETSTLTIRPPPPAAAKVQDANIPRPSSPPDPQTLPCNDAKPSFRILEKVKIM